MRNTKLWTNTLWVLVVVYGVATFANALFSLSIPIAAILSISVIFALIHGAMRYRWSGMVTFVVICLVVSNILENTSILTGFPFGHYHYTDGLGPKLFLVPLLIGPAYFSTGYLAWTLSTILVGEVRRASSAFTTFAVPLIASFVMVMWDLCLDPTASTIRHIWIWEQGGGYFGVPLTNYLGWFFTVYAFLQLFALFVRFRQTDREETRTTSTPYYAQAVVMFAVIGMTFVLNYLVGNSNTLVTDAAGVVWNTRSIAESAAIVSIYTMLFVAALAAVKLIQGSTDGRNTAVDAKVNGSATTEQFVPLARPQHGVGGR
jgi:putative membrane protein